MFPRDRDLAPSQMPSPSHPLLSHCRKPPIPQRPFTVGRKGGSCLGSLQSIIKRQIIDNYPRKYIKEAEAVTRHQSHPSLAPCSSRVVSKTMSKFRWNTVCKQQVSPAATPPSKSPFNCKRSSHPQASTFPPSKMRGRRVGRRCNDTRNNLISLEFAFHGHPYLGRGEGGWVRAQPVLLASDEHLPGEQGSLRVPGGCGRGAAPAALRALRAAHGSRAQGAVGGKTHKMSVWKHVASSTHQANPTPQKG